MWSVNITETLWWLSLFISSGRPIEVVAATTYADDAQYVGCLISIEDLDEVGVQKLKSRFHTRPVTFHIMETVLAGKKRKCLSVLTWHKKREHSFSGGDALIAYLAEGIFRDERLSLLFRTSWSDMFARLGQRPRPEVLMFEAAQMF